MKYLCKMDGNPIPAVVDVPHVVVQRVDDSREAAILQAINLHNYLREQVKPRVLQAYINTEDEPEDRTCRMCNGCGSIRTVNAGERFHVDLCTCIKRIGLQCP